MANIPILCCILIIYVLGHLMHVGMCEKAIASPEQEDIYLLDVMDEKIDNENVPEEYYSYYGGELGSGSSWYQGSEYYDDANYYGSWASGSYYYQSTTDDHQQWYYASGPEYSSYYYDNNPFTVEAMNEKHVQNKQNHGEVDAIKPKDKSKKKPKPKISNKKELNNKPETYLRGSKLEKLFSAISFDIANVNSGEKSCCTIPSAECNINGVVCPLESDPLNYDPVCGCDGNTYSNACFAANLGCVRSWTSGPCLVASNEEK